MFREPEGKKVVDMDHLTAAPTDADEVKMYVQKDYGDKDNFGPWSSGNQSISVVAPKPLSSNMDSRFVLPTKTPSFAPSNVYRPMSLKSPVPF